MSADLETAAREVITHFNNFDYDFVEGKMDDDVIVKKVLHLGAMRMKTVVKDYLDKHMKPRKPQLQNLDGTLPWNGPLTLSSNDPNDTYGRVSGTGLYSDDNNMTNTPISFTIDFIRYNAGDEWTLGNSFAAPTPAI